MNLIDLREETSFIYKNEVYYYLNPSDVKKLPITEKYKEILMSSSKIFPIDRNTMKTVSEVIRYIKINRKKFPELKGKIENYYKHILEDFFAFNIGTSEACNLCRDFSPNLEDQIATCNFEDELRIV